MNVDATHDTPGVVCTKCRHVMTHTSGHDMRPEEGDFTLCIRCGGLNVFTAAGQLRKPTKAEARAASASDELQDLHAAIMAVNAAERQIN